MSEYDDLPSWIRPGARLAALKDDYVMITVTKITRTQIVAVADSNPGALYRFDRTPTPPRPHVGRSEEWRLRGNSFATLVRRDHPEVVTMRIERIARKAADQVIALRKEYGNPGKDDKRSTEERALDLLDSIENAARVARRKVDALLNPSTIASAQYAQDLEA